MRDDLISVDVRTRQTDPERGEARGRHDAEIAGARAPEVEAEKIQPEPQFQTQPQPETQQAIPEPEPLARTSEQVARLQERSPRSLTEAQKKTIIGLLSPFSGQ
jgi:hypothetical protein